MTRKSRFFFFLVAVFLFGASGCGGSNTNTNYNYSAPSTSSITIDPADQTWTFGVTMPVSTNQDHFTITVKDANGNPMNNVKITISYPWAAPNTNSRVQFYSDGTLAVKEPSPFDAVTDKFGAYVLNYTYDAGGGLSYFGNLKAQSGSVVGTAKLTISSSS